jgi:RnfABCDGE-type electron transport complex G subunit
MDIKEIFKVSFNLVALYTMGGLLLAGVYSVTSPIIFQKNKEEKEQALSRMLPVHLKITSTDAQKIKDALPEDAEIFSEGEVEVEVGSPLSETGQTVVDAIIDGTKMKRIIKALKKAGATGFEEYTKNTPVKLGDWEPWHKHAEFYKVDGDDGIIKAYIVETYGKGYSSYINILVSVDTNGHVMKMEVLNHGETPGLGDEILLDYFKDQYTGKGKDQMVVIKGETEDKIQSITGATISSRAVTTGVKDALELLEKYESGEFKPVVEEKKPQEVGTDG